MEIPLCDASCDGQRKCEYIPLSVGGIITKTLSLAKTVYASLGLMSKQCDDCQLKGFKKITNAMFEHGVGYWVFGVGEVLIVSWFGERIHHIA